MEMNNLAGWEQLTPNDLMTIVWLIFASVLIYTIGAVLKSIINWRISKTIQVKIEKSIDKSVNEVSLNKLFKDYIEKRRLKKQKEKEMIMQGYEPTLEKYIKSR